ncbi:glycoside hydrolase family 130 protein [Cerasicoccus fimbriatus]|uniref:glycoside hydrolase family 130 protein n=1 Tax=Cerasicoccus fimbriatus TaxID=3014554 RepID=UPI0022B46C53|nr:glycosidase [Cerasicoccus sp. TK19100]
MFKVESFETRAARLRSKHENLLKRRNSVDERWDNGVYLRFLNPVVTADHAPLEWRYDFDQSRNPFLLERQGVNAAFNAGAILCNGKIVLAVRMEGNDRKSFFALAESETGIDGFVFRQKPLVIPSAERLDTNVYDMRLVKHEDGWVYGLFCTERKDPNAPEGDTSMAEAQCGIVRTKDLEHWERLPDLVTPSPQQRNVVLHPEFIDGRYMLYTRPQDGFIDAGSGGGIGYGFCDSMCAAVIHDERVMERRVYHTVKEVKNGQGPAPIKTSKGWLHLAHGVRNTATGLRYVLYIFMTDLVEPWKVIHSPAGHFIAAWEDERVGDLCNITFANGWVKQADDSVLIYYASGDTRTHVAYSTIDRLVDYCVNTPEDPFYSAECVAQRISLIDAQPGS